MKIVLPAPTAPRPYEYSGFSVFEHLDRQASSGSAFERIREVERMEFVLLLCLAQTDLYQMGFVLVPHLSCRGFSRKKRGDAGFSFQAL